MQEDVNVEAMILERLRQKAKEIADEKVLESMRQSAKRFADAIVEDLEKGDDAECDMDCDNCDKGKKIGFGIQVFYDNGLKSALEIITQSVDTISKHYGVAIEIHSSKDRKYSAATSYESGAIIKVEGCSDSENT